jgi:hypothetical protein
LAKLNAQPSREILQTFDCQRLFVEELGWSKPADPKRRKVLRDDDHLCLAHVQEQSCDPQIIFLLALAAPGEPGSNTGRKA